MAKKELERRYYSFDIEGRTEDGNDGTVILTGRPIVYGSRTDLGYFDEIIEAGALDKTDLRDVRFLVNHNTSMIPLARSRNNNANSTMKFSVDAEGMNLDFVKLDVENNADSRALASAVSRGDISGMSFMFSVDDERWEDLESEHPTRHILGVSSVVEVSAVTFPAYDDTSIAVRNKEALENAKLALESAKRSQKEALESETRSELELAKAKALAKLRF